MGGSSRTSLQWRVGMGGQSKALPMDVRFRDGGRSTRFWLRFADNPGREEQGYVNTVFEKSVFSLASCGPSR